MLVCDVINGFIYVYASLLLIKTGWKLAYMLLISSPLTLTNPEGDAVITGEEGFSRFASGAFCWKTNSKGGVEMKAFKVLFLVTVMAFFVTSIAMATDTCVTIQSGTLFDSAGVALETGYNSWGYNYQAHIFNGKYCDSYRDATWCQPYKEDDLEMKWNDAWLSNQDCDGDQLLDRHYGFGSYQGSGAWLTNHQKGTYIDVNGKKQRWTYFCKIVAAPADGILSAGTWFAADGTEIGPAIWGEFAVLQEILNDTGTGDHGVLYLSPYSAGFGRFTPDH
jgi:hypothetical protein